MTKDDQLVAAALFSDRAPAETAWERLVDAGIPALVADDPAPLGGTATTRVMVERRHLDHAQRLIEDLV